jgi:uncharacterized protein YqeY
MLVCENIKPDCIFNPRELGMTTKVELENALKDAMRSGDEVSKRTLRMALSSIRLTEVDKGGALDENALMAILQKEVKTRQEAIEEAQTAKRPDLEAEAKAEIAVLQSFLPQQLSSEELESLARQAIAETGATSVREMGQVMKVLMPRLQGRATGDQASQVVRKLLS